MDTKFVLVVVATVLRRSEVEGPHRTVQIGVYDY